MTIRDVLLPANDKDDKPALYICQTLKPQS